jgi:hypothetical protein
MEKSTPAPADRLLPVTRILAAVIVPILVAAFIILYLLPTQSGRLFAWPIKPTMSAMMLGATYLGGAYFFTRVVFARRWHTVQLGFIPVTAFAAIMGVDTLLHWDKFTHGSLAFNLWALLYFVLPFVIPVVWYFNQRQNRNDLPSIEAPLPRWLRLSIGILGGIMAIASAVLLLFPQVMIPAWAWTLSPLTARVMSAMFALPGLVGLGVAYDGRWSSASIIFQSQVLSILLFFLAMLRAGDQILWGSWGAWSFVGGLLLVLLLIGLAAWQARKLPRG